MKVMVGMPEMNREVVGRVNLTEDGEPAPIPAPGIDTRERLSIQKVSLGIAALVLMAFFLFIIVQGVFQTGV